MHDPVVSMEHTLTNGLWTGISRPFVIPSNFDVRLATP
jgi:hypothetical protein